MKKTIKFENCIKTFIALFSAACITLGSALLFISCGNNSKQNSTSIENSEDNSTHESGSVEVSTRIAIERNITKNTEYKDFNYTYAMYTYKDEVPVVKLNGTLIKGGQTTYVTFTYNVDQDAYDSMVGFNIKVDKDANGVYTFSNDYSLFSEEEGSAIDNLLESITRITPDSISEKTYEENIHDIVTYLRKKNNRVTITDVEFSRQRYNEIFFTGKAYVEGEASEDGYTVREYDMEIEQPLDCVNVENVGGTKMYYINPDAVCNVYINKKEYNEYILNDANYLEMYIKGRKTTSKNSASIENNLLSRINENYIEYNKEMEK